MIQVKRNWPTAPDAAPGYRISSITSPADPASTPYFHPESDTCRQIHWHQATRDLVGQRSIPRSPEESTEPEKPCPPRPPAPTRRCSWLFSAVHPALPAVVERTVPAEPRSSKLSDSRKAFVLRLGNCRHPGIERITVGIIPLLLVLEQISFLDLAPYPCFPNTILHETCISIKSHIQLLFLFTMNLLNCPFL